MKNTILPILKVIIFPLVITIVSIYNFQMSLKYVITNTIILEIVTITIIYYLGLNQSEKNAVKRFVISKFK